MAGHEADLAGLGVSFSEAALPPTHHVWDQKMYSNTEGSMGTAFADVATGEHAFKRNHPSQPLFEDHGNSRSVPAEELNRAIS